MTRRASTEPSALAQENPAQGAGQPLPRYKCWALLASRVLLALGYIEVYTTLSYKLQYTLVFRSHFGSFKYLINGVGGATFTWDGLTPSVESQEWMETNSNMRLKLSHRIPSLAQCHLSNRLSFSSSCRHIKPQNNLNVLWFFDSDGMYPLHKPTTRLLWMTYRWITCLPPGAIPWKVPPWMSEEVMQDSTGHWQLGKSTDIQITSYGDKTLRWQNQPEPECRKDRQATRLERSWRRKQLISIAQKSRLLITMPVSIWRIFNLRRRNLKLLYTVLLFHVHLFCAQFPSYYSTVTLFLMNEWIWSECIGAY